MSSDVSIYLERNKPLISNLINSGLAGTQQGSCSLIRGTKVPEFMAQTLGRPADSVVSQRMTENIYLYASPQFV